MKRFTHFVKAMASIHFRKKVKMKLGVVMLLILVSCNGAVGQVPRGDSPNSSQSMDEIIFRDGRSFRGAVVEYKSGYIKIQKPDGKYISGKLSKVERILFSESGGLSNHEFSKTSDSEVERQIEARIELSKDSRKKLKQDDGAIVAMYVDTEEPEDSIAGRIEYRHLQGRYSSGVRRSPFRKAWTDFVEVRDIANGAKHRITLDAGPPYEIYEREFEVSKGEVVNLGRIVLKKIKENGTSSIFGKVIGADRKPLRDVEVSAGPGKTRTDENGEYKIDGLRMGTVPIEFSKDGYLKVEQSLPIRKASSREINLVLFRPASVKLKYVISGENSNSFVGPDVESGEVEMTVNSELMDLSECRFSSRAFTDFAHDTGMRLRSNGSLAISFFRNPVYSEILKTSVPFDSITEVEDFSHASSHVPLKQGSTVLLRGYREGGAIRRNGTRGHSGYCVKIFVEKLTSPDRAKIRNAVFYNAQGSNVNTIDAASPNFLTERKVALNVLRLGGTATIFVDGKRIMVKALKDLPEGKFVVVSCSLNSDRFTSEDVKQLLSLRRLATLELGFASLSDDDLETVGKIESIQNLSLGGYRKKFQNVTDDGIKEIASLPGLAELSMHALNNVGTEGIRVVASSKSLRKLKLLSMGHLSSDDLSALRLRENLSYVQLGFEKSGRGFADKIRTLSKVETLSFYYCQFDDDAVSALSGLSMLKKVEIFFCDFTESQEKTLREANPNLKLWVHQPMPPRETKK